jgi:Flp pilus assembly pilin Flp
MNGMRLRPGCRLRSAIVRSHRCDRGQTIPEYALVIAVIAVLLIVGMLFLGGKVDVVFRKSGTGPGTLKPPTAQCDPNYGGACVPPYPPDLDCEDLTALGLPLPVSVVDGDPHGLDPDGDGLGC